MKNMLLPPLIVIVGPTGSGKSDLAVKLARQFNGELVSADSRQVYIGMDITTNKLPPPRDVKQWLVNIVKPDRRYTVRQHQHAAMAAICDIYKRNKLPILVGGTGLYTDAVAENWQIPRAGATRNIRRQLENDLKQNGLAALVRRLRQLDPSSAQIIDLKNPRRVIRALEVAIGTGTSFVAARKKGPPLFRVLKIGLMVDRQNLRERLRQRAVKMVRRGLVAETRILLKKYNSSLPAMSGIGYTEAASFINGDISKKEMIDRIVIRSMQYARRQMTWWKRDNSILWVKNSEEVYRLVEQWLCCGHVQATEHN